METFLTSLTVGVIVAVVSALVTVRVALKRFRAEQWWSRKADAYAAILEALHNSKDRDSHYLREIDGHRDLVEEYRTELSKRGEEGGRQIRKAIDTSRFLLCEEAVRVLEELRAGLANVDSAQDYADAVATSLAAVKKCLDKLPAIAKKDLGVK
jgi:hypothetical protein